MSGELKSTLDIVMEKYGRSDDSTKLSEEQRNKIAEIRRTYEAKIAETRILLDGDEKLPAEIERLERERERKIRRVRENA